MDTSNGWRALRAVGSGNGNKLQRVEPNLSAIELPLLAGCPLIPPGPLLKSFGRFARGSPLVNRSSFLRCFVSFTPSIPSFFAIGPKKQRSRRSPKKKHLRHYPVSLGELVEPGLTVSEEIRKTMPSICPSRSSFLCRANHRKKPSNELRSSVPGTAIGKNTTTQNKELSKNSQILLAPVTPHPRDA